MKQEIIYLDLFSGTGGFAKGFLSAGFIFKKHYFSEIDKYAVANYQYNFKNAKHLGDIKKIKGKILERPNLITFGSPCQDISIAGKRKGLKGSRSSLFFEAVRLIRECRPNTFIFENVKGLFSSNKGKDFEVVLKAFADIGLYDIEWQLLNTSWLLPQNRERIYVVGHLRGTPGYQVFPIGESYKGDKEISSKSNERKEISPTIDTKVGDSTHRSPYVLHWKGSKTKWKYGQMHKSPALKTQQDWIRQPLLISRSTQKLNGSGNISFRVPEATKQGYANAVEGDSMNLSFLQSNTKRGRVGKGIAHTLDTGVQQYVISHYGHTNKEASISNITPTLKAQSHGHQPMVNSSYGLRRLTPVECERLQGFPDGWTQYGIFDGEMKEISDTQRYTMLGNAVSVVVVKEVAERLTGKQSNNRLSGIDLDQNIDEQNNKKSHMKHYVEALLGIENKQLLTENQKEFVSCVEKDLRASYKHTKRSTEALAHSLKITDLTQIKELTELAIVNVAREIAHSKGTTFEKYERIVSLYNNQVILSHRTSQSILLQQYSTPAPIAYLMGVFCGLPHLHKTGGIAFEPSAGNGLLTVAAKPGTVYVNEIDNTRNRNLQTQGFANVSDFDATNPFNYLDGEGTYDAVLTNPPFGVLDKPVDFHSFPVRVLDHLMALRALEAMKDDGKAAIIIGGHTRWDKLGRIEKGKNRIFFNYLYRYYHVVDVILIDGHKLYTRQGTGFPVRLILIDGRKEKPEGVAPVYNSERDNVIHSFAALYDRIIGEANLQNENFTETKNMIDINDLEKEALDMEKLFEQDGLDELGMSYTPASNACVVLNTQVPDSMGFETHAALARVKSEVGGSMDNFVRHRLGYGSQKDLCNALSAEQIDGVAMAIYNIEARGQGMIIGDQTGIGKGRIAAAMIRYGVRQGMKPIFITEKANLFSDIYRDLSAIGSAHLKPFIINGRETKTDIKDEDGNVIYQALAPSEQASIFESEEIPAWYDFVVGTYTQFNSPERKPEKPNFLMHIAKDNLLIMDEAHNSSGSSNTGEFMQRVVRDTRGVVFLSATFAKRPDNMPIYAMKTSISEANLTRDELVDAITKGGVALQEVLSSQLVAEGQMIRRERSFEGVEVNYITLDVYEAKHRQMADGITEILRDIISFQSNYIDKQVEELDKIAVAEGKEVDLREGTSQAGVDNLPYFSKVFNVINQMLFSIKADAVADRTIERLKEGKKPVIAFASTMGSFIEQMENEQGLSVGDGDLINMDFAEVLRKGLSGVMRYTEKDVNGESIYKEFNLAELEPDARNEYNRITEKINTVSTGISISPIDMIIQKLEKAGYTVAEVTGRKFAIQPNDQGNKGLVTSRKKINTNDAFRLFNNNEVDVLMINQSGSTGASAHAIPTNKVTKEEVRQRVMIVLQAELNINTEVQKRGRINRTGQILKPIYDYMISAIPAEKRLMMMLQKKLKSLDANTTSNQKQSTKILDVPDFLNKYGDKVVKEYLMENKEINELLGDPLHLKDTKGSEEEIEDAAHKVSGRVAVLSTQMQAEFYSEITERYNDYVEYLKQIGDYDLEVEALNLETETIETSIIKMGKGGESAFADDSLLEKVQTNILKKPFSRTELENLLNETLAGKYPEEHKRILLDDFTNAMAERIQLELKASNEKYEDLVKKVPSEKKVQKILDTQGQGAYIMAIKQREDELNAARKLDAEQIQKSYKYKQEYLQRILNFFTIGRMLNYPVVSYDSGNENVLAVSLGIMIDKKKKNPYAPSSIKVRLAIANSNKYIAMPASFNEGISKIIAASMDTETPELEYLLNEWETEIKQKTKDRGLRYIITGNLLQAFGTESGKLVSYTTKEGQTKKGILMPEEWQPKDRGQQKVTVPIIKALPLLQSLTNGHAMYASNGIAFFNAGDAYRIIVPLARSKAGDIYLDKDLLALVTKNMFEKSADKMAAYLPKENIEAFATILQTKFGVSVSLGLNQLSLIKPNSERISTRKKIVLPPSEDDAEQERIRILELEAEALALELDLAA